MNHCADHNLIIWTSLIVMNTVYRAEQPRCLRLPVVLNTASDSERSHLTELNTALVLNNAFVLNSSYSTEFCQLSRIPRIALYTAHCAEH